MANPDKEPTLSPEQTGKEGNEPVVENDGGGGEGFVGIKGRDEGSATPHGTVVDPHVAGKGPTVVSMDSQPSVYPARPSLVQLGSNHMQGSSFTAAPPKKFSAVNISKKFLQSNSSTSSSAPASSSSTAAKSGGPVSRPPTQISSSHSRLVTAKLTAASPASSAAGPGWSRPSSATPPVASGSSVTSNSSSLPLPAPTIPTIPAAPQLPYAGKVIQPQPRSALMQLPGSHKDIPFNVGAQSKPVWGNIRPPTAVTPSGTPRNDFPTAAEVAQGVRQGKIDAKEVADSAAATKQARMEEADTFRGVHLDPNAHHWDEMEEDDDNFLDGVIEFGDGRQYKIESKDPPSTQPSSSQLPESASSPQQKQRSRLDSAVPTSPAAPVSKEERFADDFDRSWPRSGSSPALSVREFPPAPAPTSPVVPQLSYSPQESSRVLFNERSNRLEPYSNTHRPGQGSHLTKRGGQQEASDPSPTEMRSLRDFPSPSPSNVQLLQKPGGGDFPSRPRGFSGGSNGGFGSPNTFHGDRRDDRSSTSSMHPPPSPRLSRDNHHTFGRTLSTGGKDRDFAMEGRGRLSAMGPPPPLHSLRGSSKDSGRQLPPHLSQTTHLPPPPPQRPVPRESRFPQLSPLINTHTGLPSARAPSQSPALSLASLPQTADHVPPPPQLSAPELDEVRKDVMQNAAARAKQRRQQEEEEREKEKERARRKAAELEERMKAAEAEKAKAKEVEKAAQEDVVLAVIQEAVKSVQTSNDAAGSTSQPHPLQTSTQPLIYRPASLKGAPRALAARRPSTLAPDGPPLEPPSLTPSGQAESWRSKASPLPQPHSTRQTQHRPSTVPFLPPPPSALEQSLADDLGEELEVVDFSDLGKFIGVPEASEAAASETVPEVPEQSTTAISRASRPVASDFFDDKPPAGEDAIPAKAEESAWRRKGSQDVGHERPVVLVQDDAASLVREQPPVAGASGVVFTTSQKETSEYQHVGQVVTVPPYSGPQRTPRTQTFYKEAAMSALDDAMSRIKGALVGMQASEPSKEKDVQPSVPEAETSTARSLAPQASPSKFSPPRERWIPPALRARNFDHEPREVFQVTVSEPPRSPKPAWNAFIVRLPKPTVPLVPVSKRQLDLSTKPSHPWRWDILSFEPHVEGMNRRDLSLNDILFPRQSGGFKRKYKYRVILPRLGPRVNIPTHPAQPKVNGGTFGRPTGADSLSTWRKAPSVPSVKAGVGIATASESGLHTTSRSPPPELLAPNLNNTAVPKLDLSASVKSDGPSPVRSRLQPKMPAGSAVAFYRDSRVDVVEADPKPLVNFIVTSELESQRSSQTATPIKAHPSVTVSFPSNILSSSESNAATGTDKSTVNGTNHLLHTNDQSTPRLVQSKTESKSSDDSGDRVPITPPQHHAVSWARTSLSLPVKESPARGPDPEHLKAVWSQTSDKAGLHAVNSLEGIADDLTALPFTLQDVKSEDGETPPPSISAAPSRMSLHEVTRAFQQVPSSSSSSTPHRAPISPPSTSAPVARPSNYAYALPPPQGAMRPAYAPYPSPLMSHSPSPTVMYPHPMTASPVPSRMTVNGHTPLYGQPMWTPMGGPNVQNHGNMLRPAPSPYPAQLMPYPSPSTPMMYAQSSPNMHNSPQQPTNGQNRGRSISMMSPALQHAAPQMYPGSPVLMHAPVMQMQQSHGYMHMPVGRGQARTDSGPMPHPLPPNHHPSSHGFNAPTSPYVRSGW